jgi:hypothetical protein
MEQKFYALSQTLNICVSFPGEETGQMETLGTILNLAIGCRCLSLQMHKRLLIIARDFNQAQHWAKDQRMSPGHWVYVSSFHNIQGNVGCEYVKLPNWELRPDAQLLDGMLMDCACTVRKETQ